MTTDFLYGEHPAIAEAGADHLARDRIFDAAPIGPGAEPTATVGVANLNPERCMYTWTTVEPQPRRLRCTARVTEEHHHRWIPGEQERWADGMRTIPSEPMDTHA